MKTLLITHIDLDAIGVLLVKKTFHIRMSQILCLNYSDYETFDYEILKDYERVIYADMSPDTKSLEILREDNIKTVVIDHHESVYEEISNFKYDNLEYIYDVNKCGAKLFLEYCIKHYKADKQQLKVLTEIINTIEFHDLYVLDPDDFKRGQDLNRLMWQSVTWSESELTKRYSYFINGLYWKICNMEHFQYSYTEKDKIGNAIKKEREVFENLIGKTSRSKRKFFKRKDSYGNTFAIAKLGKKISITAFNILKSMQDVDYVIIINTYGEEETLSFRSRKGGDINLLEFKNTKGHINACGCGFKGEELKIYISDLWYGRKCLEKVVE